MRTICESIAAGIALIVLSPLLALIAVTVKFSDGGPIFYSHPRIGQNFKPFRLLKFRSMIDGADRQGSITVAGDSRTTAVGRLLRRYKLDELPQLINILEGKMQFVGPRPEVSLYVALFRDEYAILLKDRPGITDPASISYRHEEKMLDGPAAEEKYRSQILPDKLRISLAYQQRRTLLSDLAIILRTIFPTRDNHSTASVAHTNKSSAVRTSKNQRTPLPNSAKAND